MSAYVKMGTPQRIESSPLIACRISVVREAKARLPVKMRQWWATGVRREAFEGCPDRQAAPSRHTNQTVGEAVVLSRRIRRRGSESMQLDERRWSNEADMRIGIASQRQTGSGSVMPIYAGVSDGGAVGTVRAAVCLSRTTVLRPVVYCITF